MPLAQVVKLEGRDLRDVPSALRTLANEIEAGSCGKVTAIAWVIESEGNPAEVGLLGDTPDRAGAAHLILGRGMRALEL